MVFMYYLKKRFATLTKLFFTIAITQHKIFFFKILSLFDKKLFKVIYDILKN